MNNPKESVNEIVSELAITNKIAYQLYCRSLGIITAKAQRSNSSHSDAVGFNIESAFNNNECEDINNYYKSFIYKTTLPFPITPLRNFNKVDIVLNLLESKISFKRKKIEFLKHGASLLNEYGLYNNVVARVPEHYIDIAKMDDPDPNFDCHFNWYYCGFGNLTKVHNDNEDYILSSNNNKFCMWSLKDTSQYNTEIFISTKAEFQCTEVILETSSNGIFIGLRSKKIVTILKILRDSNNTMSFQEISRHKSKSSFVSFTFDKLDKNLIYLLSINGIIDIINLANNEIENFSLGNCTDITNNWAFIRSHSKEFIVYANKKYLSIISCKFKTEVFKYAVTEMGNKCNEISSICGSVAIQNAYYVGTNHHIFCVKLNFKNPNRPSVELLQRWTHGMESVPVYMSVVTCEDNKDFISVNSQWGPDVCFIINAYNQTDLDDGKVPEFNCIPWRPSNILDTLKQARQRAYCLDPTVPYKMRLSASITGSIILLSKDYFSILFINSFGDIFCQRVYKNDLHSNFESKFTEKNLEEWFLPLNSALNKTFVISEVKNFSKLFSYHTNENSNLQLKVDKASSKFSEDEIMDLCNDKYSDIDFLNAWALDEK